MAFEERKLDAFGVSSFFLSFFLFSFCIFKVLTNVLIVGTGSSYNRAVSSLKILYYIGGTLVTADHLMIHCLDIFLSWFPLTWFSM